MLKLTAKQKKRLKKQLLARKQELETILRNSHHHGLDEPMGYALELSSYDNHPGDMGTELFERGKDYALPENAEHNLEEVQTALEHMETGTYGICAVCEKPIPYARLEAIPWTVYCIQDVPDPQISFRRPVEEQVETPPFGRTSLDESENHNTQFDGEDAWQIVESWGNSNSPALAENPDTFDYDNSYLEASENEGYVESIESFLATDIYGNARMVVRNQEYKRYMDNQEGDPLLEFTLEEDRHS